MNEFNNSIIIYQPNTDQPAIDVRIEGETVWLSQRQMGELFGVDVRTISEHLSNVFSSGELEKEATIRKFRIVRREGTRNVTRSVEHYNLDAIISVATGSNQPRPRSSASGPPSACANTWCRGTALTNSGLSSSGRS